MSFRCPELFQKVLILIFFRNQDNLTSKDNFRPVLNNYIYICVLCYLHLLFSTLCTLSVNIKIFIGLLIAIIIFSLWSNGVRVLQICFNLYIQGRKLFFCLRRNFVNTPTRMKQTFIENLHMYVLVDVNLASFSYLHDPQIHFRE